MGRGERRGEGGMNRKGRERGRGKEGSGREKRREAESLSFLH